MNIIKKYLGIFFLLLVFIFTFFFEYMEIKNEEIEDTHYSDFVISYSLPDFPINKNSFILESNKIYDLASRIIGETDLSKQSLMIRQLKRMIKNYNEYAKKKNVWDIPRPQEFTLTYLLYK